MPSGITIRVIIADGQAMSGVGMLGIGGAIGPGNAANAGYHGSPGTITCPCQSLKHFDTPAATASRYLALLPVYAATMGAFLISDSSSGPSRQPGVPIADTAMICRFWNFACSFHMLWAKPMASSIVSWKSLNSLPILSQLSWKYFCGSAGMNHGGMSCGMPIFSVGLSESPYCFDPSLSDGADHETGSFSPALKNFRLPR